MGYDDFDRDPEDQRSMHRFQARNFVQRKCEYCKAKFRGMPDHGVCNRCADILERGGDPQ